jgi:hypothetical protein
MYVCYVKMVRRSITFIARRKVIYMKWTWKGYVEEYVEGYVDSVSTASVSVST